jgi:predicted dienelactone hydrolase
VARYPCGYVVQSATDPRRSRPVIMDVWYPARDDAVEADHTYGMSLGRIATGAPVARGPFPVYVLSHGAFGAARNYSWLAEALARDGAVVSGVSHFGESFVYGIDTIDPTTVGNLSERVLDCSFALDELLDGSPWSNQVDAERVAALGHSSGGATAVALAGGAFDPAQMHTYCATADPTVDRGCAYEPPGPGATPPASATAGQVEQLADPRVRAVVAMDPALGPGFDAASLQAIKTPCQFIGSVDNDFLPFDEHVGRYARLIPDSRLLRLSNGEGHFVYLDECESDRDANGVSLCQDRAGVDRARAHAQLRAVISGFLDEHLSSG